MTGEWQVCEHPERPLVHGKSRFCPPWAQCHACRIAFEAAAVQRGDEPFTHSPSLGRPGTVAEAFAAYREAMDG